MSPATSQPHWLSQLLWSVAISSSLSRPICPPRRDSVSASFLQPFLSYQTASKTTFGINAEATYDWNAGQWLVPLNLTVSQLVRIGKLPVSFAVGGRVYADGPIGAPEWGLRFVVTLVLPTGHPQASADQGKLSVK